LQDLDAVLLPGGVVGHIREVDEPERVLEWFFARHSVKLCGWRSKEQEKEYGFQDGFESERERIGVATFLT